MMNKPDSTRALVAGLGDLLEYPGEGWFDTVASVDALLPIVCELAVPGWSEFSSRISGKSLDKARELYVETFELSAACTLEVGYHLFGDTYKRGEFLAHLRREEETLGVDARGQLPDYLPLLLRLYPAIEDLELRESLCADCLVPALHTMIEKLRDGDNPYAGVLRALSSVIGAEVLAAPSTNDSTLEVANA